MIKRNQKLSSLLSGFSASNNEHLIHEIRVEIKKINAIIRLFRFNKKKLFNKKTRPSNINNRKCAESSESGHRRRR